MSVARLELIGASFAFVPGRWIFQNVDLTLVPGEVLTVLGRNGAGKSTLLSCILGVLPLSEGEVRLDGDDAAGLSAAERARRVAYLRQHAGASVSYTVTDYLLMARTPYMSVFSSPRATDRGRVSSVLAELGLEPLADRPVDELSGGERQQVDIGRALVQDAPVIVMDEPTSALDLGNQVKVLRKARDLASRGYTIVLTTHDPNQAFLLGGTVAVLDGTGSVRRGPVEQVLTADTLSDLFGTPLQVRWDPDLGRHSCLVATSL